MKPNSPPPSNNPKFAIQMGWLLAAPSCPEKKVFESRPVLVPKQSLFVVHSEADGNIDRETKVR